MQKTTPFKTGVTAAAFLLIGTLAVAQTAPKARTVKPREASSGQASGNLQRKDGEVTNADFGRVTSVRVKSHSNSTNNRQQDNNPLYQDSGKSGSNPMYESGKNAIVKPNSSASGIVGYKDPEDMTTRYRPGNNKTTRSGGDGATAHATASMSPQQNMSPAKSNPLYEDSGKSGSNPMYESGKSAITVPETSGKSVDRYREAEDNHERSRTGAGSGEAPSAQNGASSAQPGNGAAAQQRKKHPAGVKYNNITVTR